MSAGGAGGGAGGGADAPSIFVRGLPFTATDESLTAHFSAVAPVRRAFVVRDRVTHESRGFGFVQL
jgi:nucleolar protein 4